MTRCFTDTVVAATLVLALALAKTAPAASRTWDGGGANSNASLAANWVDDTAPVANDAIVLDATTNKNMIWNMTNLTVSSWTQVGYVGTVTVATIYGATGFTNFNIAGDCVISNGVWTQIANPAVNYESNRLCATIGGNLTVGTGASINVTGKGYTTLKGPGSGVAADCPGGSYGGYGFLGGPCYGSIAAPTNLGSGGHWSSGGGAILIRVVRTIYHDGLIQANGVGTTNTVPGNVQRTGAGGSIYLTAGALIGTGSIQANGGDGTSGDYGGGGRIALVVTNAGATFSAYSVSNVIALSGRRYNNASDAGAGTVYLRVAGQGLDEGTLIVDNANATGADRTEISSNVTDTAVGAVLIRNAGYLMLRTNQSLTVSGVWSNGARFSSQWGSQVIFGGGNSSTSTIYGTNTFMGFTCTNTGGKTLLFEAGKTNTVAALGRLTLKGSETATNLILRSTVDGVSWKLNVNGAVNQSIRYVDVKNSDASSGAPIGAFDSIDNSGNLNWVFAAPGQTNVWTGASNTVWGVNSNWSLGHVPLAEEFVRIPPAARHPVLDTTKTLSGGLEILNGASLRLAGYNLMLLTNAVVAGALIASNTETITVLADASFAGGTFTAAYSTVVIGGMGSQAINLGNQPFYKINVTNSVGAVTFGAGFAATELRCEAPAGTRSLVFQQGATNTLRSLVLLSATGTTNITLRSSSAGQKWNLNVTGGALALGVDVQDSDATGGKPINAIASKDSLRNTNWYFAENWSTWVGSYGPSFHVATNWAPAGVPGATSRVFITGPNTVSITSAVTVLELLVGGSLTVSSNLTVVQNLTVQANGTVTMNQPVVVSNDVIVLAGGTLTHGGPQTSETNKLDMTVFGNMGLDANAAVDVTGKGYKDRNGPGGRGDYVDGGSYGGRGYDGGPCYGSIVAPTNLGSGGQWYAGGGAILMRVTGTLRHDGVMQANGQSSNQRTGSGGSVYLTVGELIGTGSIQANGGDGTAGTVGGGGRVALVVKNAGMDFAGYTGIVQARSGQYGSSANSAGAGTIYKQRGDDRPGRGTVLVDNNNLANSGYTDVPPSPPGNAPNEVNHASVYVTNGATLRLTNDFTVGDIFVRSANAWLNLGSRTLTVNTRQHAVGPGTATNVLNYGAIVWVPEAGGTIIRIR